MKFNVFILLIVFLIPDSALAIQAHGGSEGIVVHQGGHLFFLLSLCVLVYWLEKKWFTEGKSRRYFQLFGVFLILWNLNVILMHFLDEQSDIIHVFRPDTSHIVIRAINDSEFLEYIYYFGKMDHLICVPALIFLYLALKTITIDSEKGVKE